ncbi:MAG: hypothetical protein R3C26_17780 [Calditrichia bacterium]
MIYVAIVEDDATTFAKRLALLISGSPGLASPVFFAIASAIERIRRTDARRAATGYRVAGNGERNFRNTTI